jgi:pre-mRNA-splicing factor SPF27
MVSANLEPLDHLPYLEESITAEERAEVEQLIQIELTNHLNQRLHPRVDTLLPLPIHDHQSLPLGNNNDLLNNRFDEDDDMDDDDAPPPLIHGIDSQRYQDTSDINHIYTTLSYSTLQQRNDLLATQNMTQFTQDYEDHLSHLQSLNLSYEECLSRKRKAIDALNIVRKKKQLEATSVNDYLQDRWKEGLKTVVDLGVEAKRMEMDVRTSWFNN